MANKSVFDSLRVLSKIPVAKINLARAGEFTEYTQEKLKQGKLGLEKISEKTEKRRKMNLGGPLYDTGELADGMKFKNNGSDGEAGYYQNDTSVHSDSNVTNCDLAVIHTTHATHPRPFLLNSAIRFEQKEDDGIIDREFERLVWANV